jgi:hypothetical protein
MPLATEQPPELQAAGALGDGSFRQMTTPFRICPANACMALSHVALAQAVAAKVPALSMPETSIPSFPLGGDIACNLPFAK